MQLRIPGMGRLVSRRRWLRPTAPGAQLRLAGCVIAVTAGFSALFFLNSYAAYGPLMQQALSLVPEAFRSDLAAQTIQYGSVTLALLTGYLLALAGLSGASVHWLTGATVALERQVRALKSGDYAARVQLREGDAVHAALARQLNELAEQLQRTERRTRRPLRVVHRAGDPPRTQRGLRAV